jgi:glycosyltransferase involved in cell wall biosynthesis
MHIAFITVGDPQRLTGGYLYHREVFARLRVQGYRIDEIVASAADLKTQLAAAESFGRSFEPTRYDLIVVDALARGVVTPWLDAWCTQRHVVAMVHELPSVANGSAAEQAREEALLRADRLIAVSDDGAAILAQRGVARDRIHIVMPGCDRLAVKRAPIDQKLPCMHNALDARRVLCVAQWIARKDIVGLVRAWTARPRDATLELIGATDADAVYRAEVEAAIAAAAAANLVVRGPVSEVELVEAYARAYCFALPTRYEGYGMAFAEALACGLPVVSCAVGPLPALIGDAGLLVPVGDVHALDMAITRILADEQLHTTLARHARRRAAELPTWDDTAAGFAAALQVAI